MQIGELKDTPLVSIIITSYNRASWIGQAIESALAQDYPNLEIIISDNCSTDNSDEVIKSYCHDPRIRYSRNETNIGMAANFQKAFFELAQGDYLTNISSDDYLTNSRFISNAVKVINKYDNLSIVFGIHRAINDETKKLLPNLLPGKHEIEFRKGMDIFFDFAENPNYSSAGAVYSLGHLKKSNFRFSGRVNGDIELCLLLMLQGDAGFINEEVYMVRIHSDNASGGTRSAAELENMYLDVYNYMYEKAAPFIINKPLLDKWYNKLIARNIGLCLNTIIPRRDRKQTSLFNNLMLKKYRKEFLRFLATHPRFIAKIILNR
jgi:glycosyltransferase involved in cell wall biosynthesis